MTEEPDNWRTIGEVLSGMLHRRDFGQPSRDKPRLPASVATVSAARPRGIFWTRRFCHEESCDMKMNVRDTDQQKNAQLTQDQVEETVDSEEHPDDAEPLLSERIEKHRELLDKLS